MPDPMPKVPLKFMGLYVKYYQFSFHESFH